MKTFLKTGLMTLVAVGWCGLMYPEFVMNPEIVNVIARVGEMTVMDETQAYYQLLSAEPGHIEIQFKILEYIKDKR